MITLERMAGWARRTIAGEYPRGKLDARYVQLCRRTIAGTGADGAGVVIVGANDGKFNDPIYQVLADYRDRTRVLAIEPQRALIPILEHNFAWHPRFAAHCAAVGDGGTMTLYSVAPDYWDDLVVPYAVGWPRHRAPSGIASGDRARVISWIERFLPDPAKHDAALDEQQIVAEALPAIIERAGFAGRTDILQVDVEGFDDVVLLNSDLPKLRPKLIRFEHKHLDAERRARIFRLLKDLRYETIVSDQDCVAHLRGSGDR